VHARLEVAVKPSTTNMQQIRPPRQAGLRTVLLALLPVAALLCTGAEPRRQSLSRIRLETLQRLVREAVAELGPSNFLVARKQVIDRFHQLHPDCPLYPDQPPLTEAFCRARAEEAARRAVEKAMPEPDEAALEAEAAKKFPIIRKGEVIEVTFQPNPARRMTVRDVYRGKTPDAIVVGANKILLTDIEAVEGGKELLEKLDPEKQMERRQQYIQKKLEEYQAKKKALFNKLFKSALEAQKRLTWTVNEQRGYIFMDGKWRRIPDVAGDLILKERRRVIQLALARKTARSVQHPAPAPTAPDPTLRGETTQPSGAAATQPPTPKPPPKKVNPAPPATTPAEQKQPAVKTPPKPEESPPAETPPAEGGDQVTKTKTPQPPPEPPESAGGKQAQAAVEEAKPEQPPESSSLPPLGEAGASKSPPPAVSVTDERPPAGGRARTSSAAVGIVGGVILVIGLAAAGAFVLFRRKPQGRFCGTPAEAEEFWEAAHSNKAEVKHVAFRFPDIETAHRALQQLSYVEPTADEMRFACEFPITFGCYPLDDGAVAFVGGTTLSVSMWREALDRWSRLPEAEQYRISSPPEPTVRLPDPASLSGPAAEVSVVQERPGTGDDYSHYTICHGPSREAALAFLRRVEVTAPGEYVVVETPEGHWGRDWQGIYRE